MEFIQYVGCRTVQYSLHGTITYQHSFSRTYDACTSFRGKIRKKFLHQETRDISVSRFTSFWRILFVPQVPTGHRGNVVCLYGAGYISGCDFVLISRLAVGSTVVFLKLTHFLYYKPVRFREIIIALSSKLKQTSSELARCKTSDHYPGAGGLQPGMGRAGGEGSNDRDRVPGRCQVQRLGD